MDSHYFCQKHMMGSKLLHLFYHTLQIHRAFPDHGCPDLGGWFRRQMHILKFVGISAGAHPAVIYRFCQFLRGQVDDKLACFPDNIIRIPLRPHGNIGHRRIGAHRSRPRHCNDVGLFSWPLAADHYRRKRIQHISWLPFLFCHSFLLLFLPTAAGHS